MGFLTMFTTARAEPLDVGAQAPAVTGITETGAKLDLGDVYKKGYTLVYFFPKADTPGCTAEGCSLRDSFQDLSDKGVTVIGVSTDEVAAQQAFKEKYHFPFTLLADHDHTVINAFGVPVRNVPAIGHVRLAAVLPHQQGGQDRLARPQGLDQTAGRRRAEGAEGSGRVGGILFLQKAAKRTKRVVSVTFCKILSVF